MNTYFKAVRPDGTSFRGGVDYLTGETVTHSKPGRKGSTDAAGYLSVSTVVTDCTGFSWPARLLEVEAVGPVWTPHPTDMPNKRAVKALRVVRELDARLLLGPQGPELVALVARTKALTYAEARQLGAAWDAARDAAWDAAWDAARGLVCRDLIGQNGFTQERYDLLTGPWRKVIGKIHPDDAEMWQS